jgi:hypothetical protein
MNSENELCIDSFTPDSGFAGGGDWMTITGKNFPSKISTDDYAKGGLVAHYDGINNTGDGDLYHSNTTTTWKDLAGTNDLTVKNDEGAIEWLPNGYQFEKGTGANNFWQKTGLSSSIPVGNSAITVEYVFINPSTMPSDQADGWQMIATIGPETNTACNGNYFGVQYRNSSTMYAEEGCGSGYVMIFNPTNYGVATANTLHTMVTTYRDKMSNTAYTNAYVDGKKITPTTQGTNSLNICSNSRTSCTIFLGARDISANKHADGYRMLSYRIYNKVLSPEEIKNNAEVDKNRFINPPAVTIGTQTCTNLEVIDSETMRCKIPKNVNTESANLGESVQFTFDGVTVKADNNYFYNEVDIVSVSPNVGNVNGANVIVINGVNFPYAPTNGYVKDGLIAQYDAIDNLGLGDMHHSNATAVWKDLAGTNDLTLTNNQAPSANWQERAYAFSTSAKDYWSNTNLTDAIHIGNPTVTAEYIFTNPSTMPATYTILATIGPKTDGNCNGNYFGVQYQNASTMYAEEGCNNNYNMVFNPTNYGVATANTLHTLVTTYGTSMADKTKTNAYVDGIKITPTSRGTNALNICENVRSNCGIFLGVRNISEERHANGYKIQSYRLYDRVLTAQEIQQNAYLDQLRFLSPPVVKIGTQSCTNVVVLSTSKLQCTVPKVASPSTENITVYDSTDTSLANPKTLTDAYTYVNEQSMSIATIDPKVGPSFGGSKIRLTGKNLDIKKVTIAGKECTDPVLENKNTTYTCTVPSIDISQDTFVDVVVTPNSGNNYVFAQGFQYIFARKGAVEFNVE